MDGSGRFVATEKRQALFIEGQAQARGMWNVKLEIAVHQRLAENVFGQLQRPEQLGVPGQPVKGDKGMG